MKKVFRVLLILITCIVATGCISYDFGNKVNSDRSFTIDVLYAEADLDTGYWAPPRRYDLEEIYEEQGYEVSIYQADENNSYLELKYEVENIDELCMKEKSDEAFDVGLFLSGNLNEILENGIFDCQTSPTSKIYNANFQYEFRFLKYYADNPEWITAEEAQTESSEDDQPAAGTIDISGNGPQLNLVYAIAFEKGKILNHNATSYNEENNALIWILSEENINEINFSFEIPDDVVVKYKEKEIELLSEKTDQGEEVRFKVKNINNLKNIVILDENNNRIDCKKVSDSPDEYTFIMPTTNVKIYLEYRITNAETFSNLAIIMCTVSILILIGIQLRRSLGTR